ncbi:MAG TPA: glycine--tRNA ligase [Patescibacteria group bacterium]|jgi:glycyl-tRNA synthetase|nr:glycine--tRNA ligase [Patescibacteria group bacterium]
MENLMDKLVALCKRRGFIFPGSELYGGLSGTWDLGPAGVLLSNNLKNEWWNSMVLKNDNIVGIDSSIVLNAKVWEASGHVSSFTDPLIECKICHARFRADNQKEIEEHVKLHEGKKEWTDVKAFNLMFKTYVGPVDNEDNKTYLRPETAQGIFINYKSVLESTRVRVPFGIAQIGKGFRNEITTGNFLFRVREFEMMELEYFIKPDEAPKAHRDWIEKRFNWYVNLGIDPKNLKKEEIKKEELAHYSKGTTEIWYNWPFMGFAELEGIANRGDYDLSVHQKASGRDLSYFDEETKEKFTPYVIEPSVGVGRAMLAFLLDAYHEDGQRVYLKLHPKLAPYKVAVFPLLANKKELVDNARTVYADLRKNMMVAWDDRGNIGKRYFAQDEIGTPFCITVDFQTLEDDTVTVRNRDTAKQDRIEINKLQEYLREKID